MSEKKATVSRVTIDLSYYNSIRDKANRVDALEKEIQDLKKKHDEEIHQLKDEGKIAVMVESPLGRLFGCKPHLLEVVGLEKVRPQMQEAIIQEEVSKQYEETLKELANTQAEVERLKGRGLWARIRNK